LKMANQQILDLKEGFRMGPGEWVGTYIAKAEGLNELLEIHDCGSGGDSTLKSAEIPCTPARAALPRTTLCRPQAQVPSKTTAKKKKSGGA
jgi:hypothetical protein